MSVVWRGQDEVLGRPVAVKMLTARFLAHAASRDRILTEAQAAARLSHPRITSVYDYGEARSESGAPVPYVVMELLSGVTLADRLRDGPLPVRSAMQVCVQVASALATAHDRGLVHRDVKPGNVMLTPTGVKVLDFGLAVAAGEPTSDSEVLGTPAYLAPERLTAGEAVAASDVYGLGLMLYTTLTGGMPWRAETVTEMLVAHQYTEPAPLPPITGLPYEVVVLCHRCLAKDPDERPSAYEVALELAAVGGWRVTGAPGEPAMVRAAGPVGLRASVPALVGAAGPSGLRASVPALVGAGAPAAGAAGGAPPPGSRRPALSGTGWWRGTAVAAALAAIMVVMLGGFWVVGEEPELPGIPAQAVAEPEPGLAGPPAPTPSTPPSGESPSPEWLGQPGPGGLAATAPTGDSPGGGGNLPDGNDPALGTGSGDPGTSDPGTSAPGSSDPGSSDPGSSDPGTSDPGTDPSPGPGGSDPGTDEGSDPGSGTPTPEPVVARTLSTLVGTVEAQCVGSTVTLLSWELLPGLSLGSVDAGPGSEARITALDLLLLEVSVGIRCESGAPVVG